MRVIKWIVLLGSVLSAFVLGGCIGHKQSLDEFESKYRSGLYDESVAIAMEKSGSSIDEPDSGDLLWTLQAAASSRAAADYVSSCRLFDQCESTMKDDDLAGALEDASRYLAQLMVNDAVTDYRAQVYDGIMVNAYKSLNFMAMGRLEDARIELHRTDDRQRRAVDFFAKEIQARREAIEKAKAEDEQKGEFLQRTLENDELDTSLATTYPELDQWETYPDFVNPFAAYLHGLFFFLDGRDQQDLGRARDSFGRVAGMAPNGVVLEDLEVTEKLLRRKLSRKELPPTVWVIYEDGLGPVKEERRVDIPMLFEKVKYVGIALPSLKLRDPAYSTLQLYEGEQLLGQTQVLSSMDRVVQSEFKKAFPGIAARSVLSAALKTYAQYEAGRAWGQLGSLGVGLYQAATTQADVRSWSALPKAFQIARIQRPSSGALRFTAPEAQGELLSIELPDQQFSIVYIKIPSAGAPAAWHTIGFGPQIREGGVEMANVAAPRDH